jgi:hypothetical protein
MGKHIHDPRGEESMKSALKEHHRASIILQSQGKALKAMEDLTTRLLRVKDLAKLKDGEMAMAMAIAWDF